MAPQKSSDEELFGVFTKLGISNASAELYCDILLKGRVLKENMVGTPGLIDELERAGLLHIDMDATGKEYALAIEPQVAVNALYAQRLWEHTPLEGWNYTNIDAIALKNLYDAKTYLISKLNQSHAITYIGEQGIKNIPADLSSNAISASLKQACLEILGMTSPPWLSNISLVWETIKDRIKHGVIYRRLCDEITLIAFGHQINLRDVFKVGVKLVVLPEESFTEKFYVRDKSEVFVFVPGGPNERFKLELVQVSLPPMVNVFREKFEVLWNKGASGENVIDFMNKLRTDFLKRSATGLKDNEKQIIEGLFDYGKFFKGRYVEIEQERLHTFLKDLELKGHIFSYSDTELGYLPNILDELREYIINNQI